MTKKQRKICEQLGWYVLPEDNYIMLEQFSPTGEDFFFYADKKTLQKA